MVFDEIFLHHVGAGVQSRPKDAEHVPFERLRVRCFRFASLQIGDDGQRETGQAQRHPHQVLPGVLRFQEQAREHHHRCRGRARGAGVERKDTKGAELSTLPSSNPKLRL